MMKCPKCGEELEDGATFCTNCGEKLTSVCPKCGKSLKPGAKFCSGCGANLAELSKEAGEEGFLLTGSDGIRKLFFGGEELIPRSDFQGNTD